MKRSTFAIAISILVIILAGLYWKYLSPKSNDEASTSLTIKGNTRSQRDSSRSEQNNREISITDKELNLGQNRSDDIAEAIDTKYTDEQSIDKLFEILGDQNATLVSRAEALDHLSNLMPAPEIGDKNFTRYIEIACNPSTHEYLADKLQRETLNWTGEDKSKLSANLNILKSRSGIVHDEAREILAFYFDFDTQPEKDPGKDWDKWDKLLEDYIKQQIEDEKNNVVKPEAQTPNSGSVPTQPAPVETSTPQSTTESTNP